MHILINGNPVDGFTFIGPFPEGTDAITYAEQDTIEWWTAKLEPPKTENARSHRTMWRLTAADLDAHAGRELTDDELLDVIKAFEYVVGDALSASIETGAP